MVVHPIIPLAVHLLYIVFRWIVHAVRELVWLYNGTLLQIAHNTYEKNYKECAQVLRVICKHRYDPAAQACSLRDFVLIHEKFTQPEYILKDEVTLYHVDKEEVIFVESSVGDFAWDLNRYSFSREAQYQLAIRVIILPMHAAHRLAKQIGIPERKLIFIGNTSRCGSTLLCQMLQGTGRFVAHSEPGAVTDLMPFSDCDDRKAKDHCRMAISFMCKEVRGRPEFEGHIIKIMSPATNTIRLLSKCFPGASYLFMYRDQITTMKSLGRFLPMLPYAFMQQCLRAMSPSLSRMHAIIEKFELVHTTWPMESENCQAIYVVLEPITVYYQLLKEGIQIKALRYEDLVRNPRETVEKIFLYCGISLKHVDNALWCLKKDSQEKSIFNKKTFTFLVDPTFTGNDMSFILTQCAKYGLPNLLMTNMLEGTMQIK